MFRNRYLKRALPPAILVASLLVAVGCAGNASLVKEPAVELASVEVTNVDFARQTFLLGFQVYNPNPFPLPVRGLRYKVRLNDAAFVGGETAGRFTVPADGDGSFSISVDFDLMSSGAQLTSLLRSGLGVDLDYELHGVLDLDVPTTPSLRFSSSGTIVVQAARH